MIITIADPRQVPDKPYRTSGNCGSVPGNAALPRFLSSSTVQMIAAATPTDALALNARPIFPLSPGHLRLTQSMVIGSENTNPGKKDPIPRSIGFATLLVCSLRPVNANPRKRIPSQNPGSAIEHMRTTPRTLGQNEVSGLLKSLNISNAYPSGRKLPNAAVAPNIPRTMRLAIKPC